MMPLLDITISLPTMASVSEGDGTVEVCATFSGATSQNFVLVKIFTGDSSPGKWDMLIKISKSIFYRIVVSAVAGSDYEQVSAPLTFPTGSVAGDMQCVNISIVDDVVFEGDETFTVTLTVTTSGVMERNTVTIVTIRDDDRKRDLISVYS